MTKTPLRRIASSLLITTFLALSISARADDDEPKTPLSEQMSGIAKDFRALRKVVADPAQKATALGLVKDMEDRAAKAKGFDPAKAKNVPPAEKDQFIADYKKQMDGLVADFQKLETAVNSGNTADASGLLDKLQTDKRDGHKKFNGDKRGPGGRPPIAMQSGTNGGAPAPQ
jgi:soluble cytochrome b562